MMAMVNLKKRVLPSGTLLGFKVIAGSAVAADTFAGQTEAE